MRLEPLFDNLIVKVPDEKKETDGGIVIPDTHSADRPQRGTVTAKGPEAVNTDEGDEVVFKKYSPDVIEIDGEKFWLLSEKDVMAKVKR